jgi:hypothetical protein
MPKQSDLPSPAKFIQLISHATVLYALDTDGRVWWLDSDCWVGETEQRTESDDDDE